MHQASQPQSQTTPPATQSPVVHSMEGACPPALEKQLKLGCGDRLAVMRGVWERSCHNLTPEQQEALWQVLLEFEDIFALAEDEVGLTHLVQHDIDTGDARPIKTRPRRLPLAHQAAADGAIEEMLRAGIIEPSDSP